MPTATEWEAAEAFSSAVVNETNTGIYILAEVVVDLSKSIRLDNLDWQFTLTVEGVNAQNIKKGDLQLPFWASKGERTLNKISYMEIERKHGNIMKSCYDLTLVNAEAKEDIKELVKTAESLYFDQIRRLVDRVVNGGYKFLFIGGPSAGGKTTSAKNISKQT